MRQVVHVTGLLVICLAPIGPVESGEVRFRAACMPAGSLIRLDDLAEVIGDDDATRQLANAEIMPAPAAGEKSAISAQEVCDRLRLKGVSLAGHTISGASRILLAGESPSIPVSPKPTRAPDTLRRQAQMRLTGAMVEHLSQFTAATPAWSFRFELTDEQVRTVCGASVKPKVTGGTAPWTGAQRFQFSLGDAMEVRQFELTVEVSAAQPIVVAARALGRGVVLSRADLRLETPATANAATDALVRLEDVVGRETLQTLSEGQSLTAALLQAPLLVRGRDVVTVFARCPGVRVRTTGRALEDGALGDLVTIESLADRKSFFARVCGPQEVEVFAGAGQAAAIARTAGGDKLQPVFTRAK